MRLTATSKGFVARQTCLGEHGHLVAEMAFKLLHVRAMDSTSVAEIHPPLRNLFLKGQALGGGRHAVRAFIQRPRRVSSTTRHCARWAASCARPSLVMQ